MTMWKPKIDTLSKPLYKALADAIADDIRKGNLKPAQQLPTHRALADDLGVTVGTVTRGYAEAEKRNLIVARIGSGTFVTSGKSSISDFLGTPQIGAGIIDMSLSVGVFDDQVNELAKTLHHLSKEKHGLFRHLAYHGQSGFRDHRQSVVNWLSHFKIDTQPEQIVFCNGGQNAIVIALQSITKPGDWIFSEGLTYPGFNYVARQLNLRQVGLSMDEDGILPDQFNGLCEQYKPKALYCLPTLHNPTTVTMPQERRLEIIEIAKHHNCLIIEDEVQTFPPRENSVDALVTLAPDDVIYVNSFSKVLTLGIRVGYLICPSRLTSTIETTLQTNCIQTATLMIEIVSRWINSGKAKKMLGKRVEEINARQEIVSKIFNGLNYKSRRNGLNVWLTLPEPWRADEFVNQVEKNGVLIRSSEYFAVARYASPHAVRICITSPPTQEQTKKGLEIIRDTLYQKPMIWKGV